MRQILDLQPGDHVEQMGIAFVVKQVQRVPAGDPTSPVWSPFVVDNEVWLRSEMHPQPVKFPGKLEMIVTGCDRCDDEHPFADCPRRSV